MRVRVLADHVPGDEPWAAQLLRLGFGRSFWGFAALAVVSGLVCLVVAGPDAFAEVVEDDLHMLASMVPRIVAAMGVAGDGVSLLRAGPESKSKNITRVTLFLYRRGSRTPLSATDGLRGLLE